MAASNVIDPVVDGDWHFVNDLYTVNSGVEHYLDADSTWETASRLNQIFPDPRQVARLEFIWDMKQRGVVAIDARGVVLAHLLGPLIGYEGSGGRLSGDVMHLLGVTDDMAKKIQDSVWGERTYLVVVSRTGPDEWSWDRVR